MLAYTQSNYDLGSPVPCSPTNIGLRPGNMNEPCDQTHYWSNHIGGANFQFQRGGYTVEGLDALAFRILAVLMQIDKAGRDDKTAGVNDTASGERLSRDARDFSATDADTAYPINAGFGVHDSSALDYDIVLLREKLSG